MPNGIDCGILIPLLGKDVFPDVPASGGSSRPQILFVKNMQGNRMIENTNLYEAIFKRKSVREYDRLRLMAIARGDYGTYERLKAPV